MKWQDTLYQKVQDGYKRNCHSFRKDDIVIWKGTIYIVPYMIFVPIYFMFIKYIFINILLYRRGFEETIVIFGIIFMISPMIKTLLVKFSDLALEYKYQE